MVNILYSMLCRDFHNMMIRKVRDAFEIGHEIAITETMDEFQNSVDRVYEFADVCIGDYQNYEEFDDCEPVDETIIKLMEPYEMGILEMMSRPHSFNQSFRERTILYLKHIRFWNHILDVYHINHVVFTILPHEVFDYTIYCLCRVKGITTHSLYSVLGFYDTYPRAVLCRDFSEENQKLDRVIKKNDYYSDHGWKNIYEKFKGTSVKNIEQAESNRSFAKIDPKEKYEYFAYYQTRAYIEKKYTQQKKRGEVGAWKYQNEFNPFLKTLIYKYNYYKVVRQTRLLRKEYSKWTTVPPDGEKYFYYAMHFQPEESSCPRGGGIYANQWIPIQLLSACLPKGVWLYVKEHPIQTSVGRDKSFYEEILKLGNVRLIPLESNQLRLIRNSYAVATLTGTICLEGVINGKPCISFGEALWNCMEGVFPVRTKEECKKAVDKIIRGDFTIEEKNIERFFDAIQAYSNDCNHGCPPYDPIKSAISTSSLLIEDIRKDEYKLQE